MRFALLFVLGVVAFSVQAAAIERFKTLRAQHAVGARRLRAEGVRPQRQADAGIEGQLRVPAPGPVPLDLREAGRPGDRRRRRARLDPRPRPEPGDGAQALARARLDARRRCSPARPTSRRRSSFPTPGPRTAWSGWRRSRASAKPASSACAWVSMPRGCEPMELFDHFGQTHDAAFLEPAAQPEGRQVRIPLRAAQRRGRPRREVS